MKRRCLAFFYYSSQGGENIIDTEWNKFYKSVETLKPKYGELEVIPPVGCSNASMLRTHIERLIGKHEEIHLHLSGHGNEDGIPYRNWLLEASDLTTFIDKPQVKFCFFSSCRSSVLAELANARHLPVVIGTKGCNDIENSYAIEFQTQFYTELFKGETFETAFKNACVNANTDLEKKYQSGKEVLRSEGGRKQIVEDRINALQIIFASDNDKKCFLIPPDFISTMLASKTTQPWLLNWFADGRTAGDFREAFDEAGFDQRIQYLAVSNDQLVLLLESNRGADDPLVSENVRMLVHCRKGKEIHEHLYKHIKSENNISGKNYQVLCCMKESEKDDILEENPLLKERIPENQFFFYNDQETELFANDRFVQSIDLQEISLSHRKEIAFNFSVKPTKREIVEMTDNDKFVRIFFTNMFYEKLINYIVNWIKPRFPVNPLLIVDTDIQPNFKQGLEQEVSDKVPESGGLKNAFSQLMRSGVILVIRKRGGVLEDGLKELQLLIEILQYASDGFDHRPTTESLVFFQHDYGTDLTAPGSKRLFLKYFQKPQPVDEEILGDWCNRYAYNPLDYNPSHTSPIVSRRVSDIAQKIKPAEYQDSCPSAVIDFICQELGIPTKQVTEIR